MLTIIVMLGLVVLSVVLIFVPTVFGLATKNCVRLDGTISHKRVSKEIRHLARYCGAIVGILVFLLVVLYLSVVAVHTYVIPMELVSAVFDLFDTDPESWERAIKGGPMGNLDQQFENWSQRQGYDPDTPEILADIFFENWLTIVILCVLTMGLIALLQIRVFVKITQHYAANVLRRRAAYQYADRRRSEQSSVVRHLEIIVPDIDAAVDFLGVVEPPFRVLRDLAGHGVSRQVDIGTDQHCVTLRVSRGDDDPVANRIAWLVEDFESVVRRLEQNGYLKGRESEPGAIGRHAYYQDFAGLEWEISEYSQHDSAMDSGVEMGIGADCILPSSEVSRSSSTARR